MLHSVLDPLLVDGVVLTREALALGLSEKQLRNLVRSGTLVRILHGVYAEAAAWEAASRERKHLLRATAVLRRYGDHVVLSHNSAVLAHGGPLWGLPLSEVHVTHLRGGGRREASIRHHRGRCVEEELVRVHRLAVTSVARTVVDISATTTSEVSVAIASHFLHAGATSKDELVSASLRRRTWPGTLADPVALSVADPRLESVGESRCWYLFWRSELPMPIPQFPIYDRGRELWRLDFAWPELGIFVEFDGKEKYLKHRRPGESVVDAVLRERARESDIIERTGWDVVRLDWADLARPAEIIRRIDEVVARRHRSQSSRIAR